MGIEWTQTNQLIFGKFVRQSYTATDANSNILVREICLTNEGPGVWNVPSYNEQPQGQSQLPGHDHTDNYAEAMAVCAPGTTLAGWLHESQIVNGERTDNLWSNAVSDGSILYLSLTTIKDTPPAYLTTAPGNHRIVAMSMVLSPAAS